MTLPVAAFELYISAIVMVLEASAAAIILVAAARALWGFARTLRKGDKVSDLRRAIQRRFARSLLLGLDFTIGADVLKVAQAPNLDRVLVIGLVVLVRVLLTFAIEFELTKEEEEERRASQRERVE